MSSRSSIAGQGKLSVGDYREYCLGWTTELVQRIKAMGVPVIYFGVDTASLLPAMRETGADVIGLDWRVPLDVGWKAVGPGCAVQGNLDPITLFAPEEVLKAQVQEVLRQRADGLDTSSTLATASCRVRRWRT
jgi:uroporphyrinogen decarboxylase